MARDLLAASLAPIITWVCYFTSLRRTPYRTVWWHFSFFCTLIFAPSGAAIAQAPHITTVGVFGAILGLTALPAFFTFATEFCNIEGTGSIAQWRREEGLGSGTKKRKDRKWTVTTTMHSYDGKTEIAVTNGSGIRVIGTEDPIANMEDFLALRAQAEDTADTLNALKIGG